MKIASEELDELMVTIAKRDFGDKPFARQDLMDRTEEVLKSRKLWEKDDSKISNGARGASKGYARIDYRFIALKYSQRLWNIAHGFWQIPDDATFLEASDSEEPPKRVQVTIQRIIRDTPMVRELKRMHNNKCQCCGVTLILNGRPYSEGHHLRPLGGDHKGLDKKNNIVILCPNCHVEFDYKAVPYSCLKHHIQSHELSADNIKYHDNLHNAMQKN